MLELITAPTAEPISLSEAKAHARVFLDSDNDFITGLIQAAREKFERETGYHVCEAEYKYTTSGTRIILPLRPVLSVEAVNDLAQDDYVLSIDPHNGVGTLTLLAATSSDVEVTFKVGYENPVEPDDPEEETPAHGSPALIKHALKSLVAHWYSMREAYGDTEFKSVPGTFQSVVTSYRLA